MSFFQKAAKQNGPADRKMLADPQGDSCNALFSSAMSIPAQQKRSKPIPPNPWALPAVPCIFPKGQPRIAALPQPFPHFFQTFHKYPSPGEAAPGNEKLCALRQIFLSFHLPLANRG